MNDSDMVNRPSNSQHKSSNVFLTIVVMVGLFIAIGAWYNNTHYSSTFQDNYMSNCEKSGSVSGCGCSYGILQANYSYSQARAMDANPGGYDGQMFASSVSSQCR